MNTGRTGRGLWWATAVVASFTVLTFLSHGAAQTTSSTKVRLEGAGATFPAPLYKKWIGLYASQNPDVSIEYRDVGSGEGVKRFLAQSVDFGASDGALTDEQMATLKPGARLVPATAGIVVLAYNLPGIGGQLRLSREVYADIFLRKIDKWNDPRLQAINPTLNLPNRSIAIAARQDGSGTTFALANHLSAVSEAWRSGPGVGYLVDWGGRAMRARGNEGVAALMPGSSACLWQAFKTRLASTSRPAITAGRPRS